MIFQIVIGFCLIYTCLSDTPANCTYDDIVGTWYFVESERIFDSGVNCNLVEDLVHETQITLEFPNFAVDKYGHKGTWTLIYNQGFEVNINYRKYFAFSFYENNENVVKSYCDRTLPGTSHNVLGKNWSCFRGKKAQSVPPKENLNRSNLKARKSLFKIDRSFIRKINNMQNSWSATHYTQFENKTYHDLFLMAGGPKSRIVNPPQPAVSDDKTKKIAATLPDNFDWRNVSGINYVSPVRDQGHCGSCYTFASVGMIESRLRIYTKNEQTPVLSTQDIISCSNYSQGCEGGFSYLVAGKYSQDYGLVSEGCYPYEESDTSCKKTRCPRTFVAHYEYVGGFYGACNEDLMKISLVKNGPLAIAFEVYSDFMNYESGIYHHTNLLSKFNPFEITNHAVLLVGYGVDNVTKEKYWIVKNSWGVGWGENGYFRIKRGTNECNIESMALEAFPIP